MANSLFRRKRYIVKKEFQLKYAGLILAVVVISTAITGITIYCNSWLLLGAKLASVYPQGRLISMFRAVNMKLAFNMGLIALLSVFISFFVSHKIAGPVYKITNYVKKIEQGDYSGKLTLRKGDEFQELAEAINTLVDKLAKG